ncbi:MAG TPA: hypothetical protein VJR89_42135 [Polyangiales bacterium]|nr:hypothetical protein [Polyangiales bacterium]
MRLRFAHAALFAAALSHGSSVRADAEPEPSALATLAAGTGVGQRQVHVPARRGELQLDSGSFAALDVRLAGEVVSGSWVFGAQAHYQTSLGVEATTTPPNGVAKQTSLRLHHLDFGLDAGLRFSEAPGAVNVRLFAGWAFRGLRPVIDLDIPPYTLHGPVLRLELRVPIAGLVALRIAPELFVLAHVSNELRHAADSASAGIALGVEIDLELKLSRRVFAVLGYRESRARVGTAWDTPIADDERFMTGSLGLRY